MSKTGSQESWGSQNFDFDAPYRGESPGEGIARMTTPPWDTKEPSESVIAWQTGGWVHGDVLGGAGWDIASPEPATLPGELDGAQVEMAFWYLRAQRR